MPSWSCANWAKLALGGRRRRQLSGVTWRRALCGAALTGVFLAVSSAVGLPGVSGRCPGCAAHRGACAGLPGEGCQDTVLLWRCERPGQFGGRQPLLALPHGLPAEPSLLVAAPSFWWHEERLWLGLVVLKHLWWSLRGRSERYRLCRCLIAEVVSEGNRFHCLFYFISFLLASYFLFSVM